MNLFTIIFGAIIVLLGIYVAVKFFLHPESATKMLLLQQKFGVAGKIIYFIGYVLFPLSLGAIFIWAGVLGVSIKDMFLS